MITPREAIVWAKFLLPYGGWAVAALIVTYVLYFPDRAEKAAALFWKLFSNFWIFGEKKYIQHDIQGRVNNYVNNFLSKEICGFQKTNIKLEWTNKDETEEHFHQKGKLIVRMRKGKNQNQNFVNAAMVFISTNLLKKTKSYISSKQKESVDLFVGRKLFEQEKEEVVVQFVNDFFKKGNKDKKIGDLLEKYDIMDQTGLFFPIFIQEMNFLGEKVFATSVPLNKVYEEVNKLVDFLSQYSERKLGEDSMENNFNGLYSRFGIMIIGKNKKITEQGARPYKEYIKSRVKNKIETNYLVGNSKKQEFVTHICTPEFLKECNFFLFNERKHFTNLKKENQDDIKIETYLSILRSNKIDHYFSKK